MNHPIYITANSSRDDSGGGVDAGSLPGLVDVAAQPSFERTQYYTPAPASFQEVSSSSMFSPDRKDYLLTPMLCSTSEGVISGGRRLHRLSSAPSSSLLKEHPAAEQADQMNNFIDTYFVDHHEASTSGDTDDLDKDMQMVDDDDDDEDDDEYIEDKDSMDDLHKYDEENKRLMLERDRRLRLFRQKNAQRDMHERELDELLKGSEDMQEIQEEILTDRDEREERTKLRRAEAARTRYQRMTEAERRAYNHRRRLKQLGLDPDSRADMDMVRRQMSMANAKKAEAARQRYHRMTSEEKREYNQRRTEAFRRRRLEEDRLLSTPAGRISAEALAKAQQIMIRNARKAEAARLRYQKMSQTERKEYNTRRAQAKRARQQARSENHAMLHPESAVKPRHIRNNQNHQVVSQAFDNDPPSSSSSSMLLNETAPLVEHPTASSSASPEVSTQDDIFLQMERDVIKRTKQAHMVIARQQMSQSGTPGGHQSQQHQQQQTILINQRFDLPMDQVDVVIDGNNVSHIHQHHQVVQQHAMLSDSDHVILSGDLVDAQEKIFLQEGILQSTLIDEKSLQQMLLTGMDANGRPVEIHLTEGSSHIGNDESFSNGHSFVFANQVMDAPTLKAVKMYDQDMSGQSLHYVPTTSSQHALYETELASMLQQDTIRYRSEAIRDEIVVSEASVASSTISMHAVTLAQKHAISKARRAERARLRYHSMEPGLRQAQNAKRAAMLRKARARDDELCQLADTVGSLEELEEQTRRAVVEAQTRRSRRAEQARAKYHRMNSEERKQYNAMRDAQRRQRKREQENRRLREERGDNAEENPDESCADSSLSPGNDQQVLYSSYDIYPQDNLSRWEQ